MRAVDGAVADIAAGGDLVGGVVVDEEDEDSSLVSQGLFMSSKSSRMSLARPAVVATSSVSGC